MNLDHMTVPQLDAYLDEIERQRADLKEKARQAMGVRNQIILKAAGMARLELANKILRAKPGVAEVAGLVKG